MTNAELNARAAEIMGWKKDSINREWYISDDGKARTTHLVAHWNPAENIAQAFELAHEMCEDYELKYNGDIYDFTIAGVLRRGDSLPDTITRACVAAWQKVT